MKQAAKTAVVLAASTVAIPYTVAFLAQVLYGWPKGKDKYKRAFQPFRVYKINYAVLLQLSNIRYIPLLFKWKYFYNTAEKERLLKDIPYGSHENKLDIYFPLDEQGTPIGGFKPVIMFIYGGTWGSGDKNMYGLLCSNIADRTNAIVVCPNYSIYPKGFVDDMVQDTVDALSWVHKNILSFGGDKERVMLLGHSAGAHLCTMAVIELVMKRLMENPQSAIMTDDEVARNALSRQSSIYSESMKFEEQHFDRNGSESNGEENGALRGVSSDTGSFYVVKDDNGLESRKEQDSFYVINEQGDKAESSNGSGDTTNDNSMAFERIDIKESEAVESKVSDDNTLLESSAPEGAEPAGETSELPGETPESPGEGPDTRVLRFDTQDDKPSVPEISISADTDAADPYQGMSQSQRDAVDILSSVKVLMGLSGVYHIGEHYEYESWRCVEDISTMAKAMYGPEHFDRFSPAHIIPNLPKNTRLPPIHLVHGDVDKTVPLGESERFAQVVWDMGTGHVQLTVIPGCGHADICLDLMDAKRKSHEAVMGEVMKSVKAFL